MKHLNKNYPNSVNSRMIKDTYKGSPNKNKKKYTKYNKY